MTACDRCHGRKTRCDRHVPECGACMKSGARCRYPEKLHYREAQRNRLESLEQRLLTLQRENQDLRRSRIAERTAIAGDVHDVDRDDTIQFATATQPSSVNVENVSTRSSTAPVTAPSADPPQEQHLLPTYARSASQAQYLGSSAGVDFINLVESVVDSPNPTGNMFAKVSRDYCRPRTSGHTAPQSRKIPVQAIAMQLIATYFEHWHVTFPLLYRPAFMQIVNHIYDDSNTYLQNRDCAFVFNMVLALGSAASKRFEWSFKDTESHFVRAMDNFDEIIQLRDIRTFQALLLCCQYGIHASLRDTAEEMWDLLGKAQRLCVEIGLHQLGSSPRKSRCEVHLTGPMPIRLQAEMQRRCFWCFYSLDRIVSVTLGRTLTLSDNDIDTPLPSGLDDDKIGIHQEASGESPPGPAPQPSPFLQLILIRRILAKIHQLLYTNVSTRSLSIAEKLAIRQNLISELGDWKRKISHLALSPNSAPSLALSSFQCQSWWEAIYHNAVLLIFRPSTIFPHPGQHVVQGDEDVLRVLWETSRAIISNYKEVLQARRLNYSWICLYTIFMAGLANVYSVGRSAHRRKGDHKAFSPDITDVMTDIKDCSNILTAICERWDDARSSCEIFSRLSKSAFNELVKVLGAGMERGIQPPDSAGEAAMNVNDMDAAGMAGTSPSTRSMLPRMQNNGGANFQIPSPNAAESPFEGAEGFQHVFLDMQSSLYDGIYDGPNEVWMGLGRDWFEQID